MQYPNVTILDRNRLPTSVACTSAAARDMLTRLRSGRVEHLDIKALGCQEAIEEARFRLMKVDSDSHPADNGNETLSADRIVHVVRLLGMDASRACSTTVESNEDDTMNGSGRSRCDSKVESQHHGQMSVEHLNNKPSGIENLQFKLREREPENGKLWTRESCSSETERSARWAYGTLHFAALHRTTVSYVTLCWYQREHDHVRHHSCPVCISPILVLCVLFGPRNSNLGKGRKLEPPKSGTV